MATILDFGAARQKRAAEREWDSLGDALSGLAAQARTPVAFAVGDRVQLRPGAQRPDWYDVEFAAGRVWGEVVATPYGNRRAVGYPVFNVLWHRQIPADRECGGCARYASGSTQRPCSHHGRWSTELVWYMCQMDLEPLRPRCI